MRVTGNPWAGRRPLFVAHRGGALEAPENTLHAFRHGRACGAHMLELDVHGTFDGEAVVIHDATLERTTNGTGAVAQQRLADVAALDAAHWFVPGRGAVAAADAYPLRGVATGETPPPEGVAPADLRVPTLGAVLEALPDTWVTLELKADGVHERVASLLAEHSREDAVIVGGFAAHRVEAFRATAPRVATSATEGEVSALWAWAHGYGEDPGRLPYAALQVPSTHEGIEVVTEAFVARAHERGVAVHVWTVDEPADMHRLLDLGVDAIMTDRPTVLAAVLAARGDR